MDNHKENSPSSISNKVKAIGIIIALMIPVSSMVFSIILLKKNVSLTDMVKEMNLLDRVAVLSTRDKREEKEEEVVFSAFAKDLNPIFTDPQSIVIKSINLKVNLVSVQVDSDGVMETPKDWSVAGWYQKGGLPGEERNLIINGHFDSDNGAPAAFWKLKSVKEGSLVEVVDRYGRIFNYKVVELAYVDVKDPSRLQVLDDEKGRSTLTLITCGGVWLQGSGYNKRLVVKAVLDEIPSESTDL